MNLRWSWHAPTRDLFEALDPGLWETVGGNPVALVRGLDMERIKEIGSDRDLLGWIALALEDLHTYLRSLSWCDSEDGPGRHCPTAIAYFSPEYGITSVLPQYSGGLGILAGDHLKSASDMGVPIIGIGLLYGAGYFRQALALDGSQTESYPELDPFGMPLHPLHREDGSLVEVSVALPGDEIMRAVVWKADVGKIPLLLLDTDVESNSEELRTLTDRLYGGDAETRIRQELLLGVGGMRALREFCRVYDTPLPTVFHMNEGHAGFVAVERIRERMFEGLSFAQALEASRKSMIFTTHTTVPAGIDRFDPELVSSYFSIPAWGGEDFVRQVLALGEETEDWSEPKRFNMALMGLRVAGQANGVSLLHGEVSREMFRGLWPDREVKDVPIGSITNGVHAATWMDRDLAEIEATRLGGDPSAWEGDLVSDEELWGILREQRIQFVEAAQRRLQASLLERGFSIRRLRWVHSVFDPDVLTIAFARRVPTYKRLTLMLRDPERLRDLLVREDRRIQIVVAGKAHPHDEPGKGLIQDLVEFTDREDIRQHMVFLPNCDMAVVGELLPGCDVWLNNPVRPYEACGTSGMKAALNGALNLSTRDGWWDEWSDGRNGWDIPSADGAATPEERDDLEARWLYEILEDQVIPLFYDNRVNDIPVEWVKRVRHTLATLGPKVQATRMVRDYTTTLYVPAARVASGPLAS
ncbi:MAG: alpha-glucan family phosphorylase [Demequinaceae bacterium]|nr:alpha-glucan family phosphorylase [Demequinaceae bacterium]